MKHYLSVCVSKEPKNSGIVTCRTVTVREKILQKLLGTPCKVTVLVPGDTVSSVSIREINPGGEFE